MSRNLGSPLAAALSSPYIIPVLFVMLTFRSGPQYVWSGIGDYVYNAQTYKGVGSLGSIGVITEGTDIKADGTTVKLSGIDPVLYGECMTDIQVGAPAKIWFGLMLEGTALIGVPYLLFSGTVDAPSLNVTPESLSITLNLENSLINLQRPSQRRYTSTDQRHYHPNDRAFDWVEMLNDLALLWGSH